MSFRGLIGWNGEEFGGRFRCLEGRGLINREERYKAISFDGRREVIWLS